MTQQADKAHGRDTEARILRAAEREFLDKGFAGARTTSIAEAAGVTHAMFHYYFRTKEKLFDSIIADKIDKLKAAIERSMGAESSTLEETIRGLIDVHLDFLYANPELPRFLITEIYSRSERAATFIERLRQLSPLIINRLQTLIDQAVEQSTCRRTDAKMLLLDIVSLNVFAFVATPIVNAALDGYMDESGFLARRKENNFATIMAKLKP